MPGKSFVFQLLLSLTIGSLPGFGQDRSQNLLWARYQNQLQFSPDVYWNNEVDNRRFIDPDGQHQFIFHSRIHLKKGSWDYATGLTLSWAYGQYPDIPVSHAVLEIRPVAEVSFEHSLRKVLLQHRMRVDNRFIEENKSDDLSGDFRYNARFRYRFQARMLLGSPDQERRIGLRFADEFMVNSTENFFDQNRIYLSAEYPLNSKWSAEAGYIYLYQQRFGREEFLSRHVLRLSVLHKIRLY